MELNEGNRGEGLPGLRSRPRAGSSEQPALASVLSSRCFSRSHAHPLSVTDGKRIRGREFPETFQLPFGEGGYLLPCHSLSGRPVIL